MQKDFDSWNKLKQTLDNKKEEERLYFKDAEVRWVNLGINVGFEMDGKDSYANLSQIRNLDSKRLINKVGHIEEGLFKEVKKKVSEANLH